MAITEVSICNTALTKIGASRILSLTEESERAKTMLEVYDIIRDSLLSSHPWKFAVQRAELAALVAAPSYEWSYQFQLPSDCLRVIGTDLPNGEPWQVEGDKLLCNYDTLKIKYIRQLTDTSMYSAYFVELLACALAATVAYRLTQSTSIKESMQLEYDKQLKVARSFNAQEGAGDRVYADTWLNSRI